MVAVQSALAVFFLMACCLYSIVGLFEDVQQENDLGDSRETKIDVLSV